MLGERPRALLPLAAPTLLSILIDLVLRGRDMLVFEPHGKAIYFSSLLVSSAFWGGTLLLAARLLNATGAPDRPSARRARVALGLLFGAWIFPIAACSYGGQLLYFHVFRAYAGRDTLRLGALLRGTYGAWFLAWSSGGGFVVMLGAGALVSLGLFWLVRRTAPDLAGRLPALAVVTFLGALFCFWTDNVDSRFLQAATPDTCFLNGAAHALRAATTGGGRVRQGVTLRRPATLAPFVGERARPPNIVLVITESVRADVSCSDPPPACRSRFLDAEDAAGDRLALGKLTSQTPNTFSASMVLWSGLAPDADFADAHAAPLLWEIARALGYRTAYVTSQNARYEDFGVFVHDAGIDVRETATELGGMAHEQLGAPDERATAGMLRFVRDTAAASPYFAVLQLSNTHHPYRVDPELQPFAPHVDDPSVDVHAYFNHYRNSVLMQERLLAGFLRELRALPSWDDTAVVFVSDHGEQFGEHGHTHHNHSLFDVDLRIPGWIVAGARALDDGQRAAIRSYAGVRTFSQDVNATVVDLMGARAARRSLPYGDRVPGRSLLRPHDPAQDPVVLLATSTGVWEPYDAVFGVMRQERVLVGAPRSPWTCYDLAADPGQKRAAAASKCQDLRATAERTFR
jgi:hypothetical protein